MQHVIARGVRAFAFGLTVVLGSAIYMFLEEVPPGSDVGQVLFLVSAVLGFSLGLLLRRREESQRLFSLALLPIPISVLMVSFLFASPDFRYSELFDRSYIHGIGPILLLSSFLSSFMLPYLFAVRHGNNNVAPSVIEKRIERCSECGGRLRSTWNTCPYCGAQIDLHDSEPREVCPSCRKAVETKWVRCPYCSVPLNAMDSRRRRICPNCGETMKPSWMKCPHCAADL